MFLARSRKVRKGKNIPIIDPGYLIFKLTIIPFFAPLRETSSVRRVQNLSSEGLWLYYDLERILRVLYKLKSISCL